MAYRPLGDNVLVERIAAPKETSSGIILKTTQEPDRAKIIAIGGNGAFVDTSSTQTVGGTKTFSSTITGSVTGNAGTATALL